MAIHTPFHEYLRELEASIDCIVQFAFEIQLEFAKPSLYLNQICNDYTFRLAKPPYVLYQIIQDVFSYLKFRATNWHNEIGHQDFRKDPILQLYFSTILWFLY